MENKITTAVELITPEKASEYLSHNNENRTLNKRRVQFYVYQMQNGKWGFDPSDSITFDKEGNLLNGQHRLEALKRANVTAEFNVMRGVDKATRVYMDTGKPRNGGDVLSLMGYANSTNIASMINFLIGTLRKGWMPQGEGYSLSKVITCVSNNDILREYESASDLYQTIYSISQREYKKYRLFTVAHFGGVCAFLVRDKHYDLAKVEEFYKLLNDCEEGNYQYLIYLKRKIVGSLQRTSEKDRLSIAQKLVMLSRAWNYFIAGEDRKVITCKPGDKIRFE